MRKRYVVGILAALVLWSLPSVGAEVRLPSVFGDHVVLQRESEIPVWGTADPGEAVRVALGQTAAETTADAQGRWMVKLPPMSAGGPHALIVSGSNRIQVSDVLIGEVWLCSGQSNMNMPIDWGVFGAWGSPECTRALEQIDDPQLRMFLVDNQVALKRAEDVGGQWKLARHNEVLKWSAAAYFFGVELRRELDVPVGLLKSAVGGTPVESWMPRSVLLEAAPEAANSVQQWDRRLAAYDEAAYQQELAKWQAEAEQARKQGKNPPRRPRRLTENPWIPNSLYNGMIAPLVPYAMRGVIWYQGESNARNASLYRRTFPALITNWRKAWGAGEFPFLFVQLANFRQPRDQPGESDWAELREAQSMALKVPNTAMAVAIDIGEADDIHPKNKQDVGRRLALGALDLAYGQNVVHSGPIYRSMEREGDRIRIQFDHVGGGLAAKGGEPTGFAIAGRDRRFVWAKARIDGDSVVVSRPSVPDPLAVRYGWADNPQCNLYNREGLPASPFRTDNWARKTD